MIQPNGYVDSLNKYWELWVDAINKEGWTEESLESKKYGKCNFTVEKDNLFIISFDNEVEES